MICKLIQIKTDLKIQFTTKKRHRKSTTKRSQLRRRNINQKLIQANTYFELYIKMQIK